MTNKPGLNSHELDFLIASGRQFIGRMLAQVESGKVNARDFTDYLKTLDKTFVNLGAEGKTAIENERLAHLYKVSRLIGASLDLQTVLEQVMDALIQLTGAERGFLMLLEDGVLGMRVARNFDRETLDSDEFQVSSTITSRVIQTGQAIVTTNAMEDPRFRSKTSVIADKLSSIMASPLVVGGQILGVIYVDNRARKGLFFEDDLKLLDMFGEQAAIAISNAVQVQQRESHLKAQIEALRIEVDEVKKQAAVAEIVESEYFQKLTAKAREMRKRGPKDPPVPKLEASR